MNLRNEVFLCNLENNEHVKDLKVCSRAYFGSQKSVLISIIKMLSMCSIFSNIFFYSLEIDL